MTSGSIYFKMYWGFHNMLGFIYIFFLIKKIPDCVLWHNLYLLEIEKTRQIE